MADKDAWENIRKSETKNENENKKDTTPKFETRSVMEQKLPSFGTRNTDFGIRHEISEKKKKKD